MRIDIYREPQYFNNISNLTNNEDYSYNHNILKTHIGKNILIVRTTQVAKNWNEMAT